MAIIWFVVFWLNVSFSLLPLLLYLKQASEKIRSSIPNSSNFSLLIFLSILVRQSACTLHEWLSIRLCFPPLYQVRYNAHLHNWALLRSTEETCKNQQKKAWSERKKVGKITECTLLTSRMEETQLIIQTTWSLSTPDFIFKYAVSNIPL